LTHHLQNDRQWSTPERDVSLRLPYLVRPEILRRTDLHGCTSHIATLTHGQCDASTSSRGWNHSDLPVRHRYTNMLVPRLIPNEECGSKDLRDRSASTDHKR